MHYSFKTLSKYIKCFFIILIILLSSISLQALAEINKKSWTDHEIIDLGYMPDEVVIKFNK